MIAAPLWFLEERRQEEPRGTKRIEGGGNPTWTVGRRGMAETECCLFLFGASG